MNCLLEFRDKVDEYKIYGKTSFTDEEYVEAKEKYLNILTKWDEEFKKEYAQEKEKYYKDERCLKTRLRIFADDHLRFLTDFRIDFTNKLS